MPDRPEIQAPWVADATATEMDFLDSSFFASKLGQKHLPTPTEVAVCSPDFRTNPRPKPVKFEHLGLIVKFGPCVVVEEAICLRMLRRTLPEKVPVPEVYGWRVEEGSITRRFLLDYVFQAMPSAGPFKTVKEFNDWFSALPQQQLPDLLKYKDPYREFLPDDGTIRFTHGDLHRGNIIVSRTDPPRVMAVIDWTHAGWYPDYWEYCKALYTSDYNGEWRNTWIPRFLEQYPKEFAVFSEYVMQIGAV
ncbi:phosphotransferase enzyme family protein [Histoplasma capsulatum var. duboisii H88]|uniref:Phosphotransferase enzyme family protein n=1 Tax=Ajellomyces capsulatus (strain H88) TaxID=544711 RepID=F0UIR0_AJEC8|nr:phosphotransferase enzyme family protein [Histoplasma capsulatum var. duboisii H88]